MLEKGMLLTLADNNEYTVVDSYTKNGKVYVYLVDINNNTNVIYATCENDEIVEIIDVNELEDMIKTVNENLHKA